MLRTRPLRHALVLLTAWIVACHTSPRPADPAPVAAAVPAPAPKVRIATDELAADNIRLVFDTPMAIWDDSSRIDWPLTVTPAADCRWHWSDDATVRCHLASALEPATRYQVEVGRGLYTRDGEAFPPAMLTFDSRGPELQPKIDDWGADGRPRLVVGAWLADDAETIRQHLALRAADGREIALSLRARGPHRSADAERHDFELIPDSALPPGRDYRLEVLPGLALPGHALVQHTVPQPLRFDVDDGFAFLKVDCWIDRATGRCKPESPISLAFNGELDASAIAALQRALPPPLAIAADHGRRHDARSRKSADVNVIQSPYVLYPLTGLEAGQDLQLVLPSQLADLHGRRLGAGVEVALRVADAAAAVFDTLDNRVLLPEEAAVAALEYRNVDALSFLQWRIGNGSTIASTTTRVDLAGLDNHRHTIAWPGGLGHGGYVVARAGDASRHERLLQHFSTVVASQAVSVANAGGRLQLTVRDWHDGAPARSTTVELIEPSLDWSGLRTLASTRTDGNGVAQMQLSSTTNTSFGGRLLRVGDGAERTLVPLPSQWSWLGVRRTGTQLGWTDKPHYRPGESVRFRLYLREVEAAEIRRASHPVDGQVILVKRYDDQPLAHTQTLHPDAFGGVDAEIALPAGLADDDYRLCFRPDVDDASTTPCSDIDLGLALRVAAYRPAELWTTLTTPATVVGPGAALTAAIESGYYSGGAAPELDGELLDVLTAADFAEAYPAYANYRFATDDHDASSHAVVTTNEPRFHLDAEGKSRLTLTTVDGSGNGDPGQAIAFGRIRLYAHVQVPAGAGADSAPRELWFARHRSYLGLAVEPALLEPGIVPTLTAVVVAADGRPLAARRLDLEIARWSGVERDPDDENRTIDRYDVVAHCTVDSTLVLPCGVRPAAGERYRFRLSGGDSAATEVMRWTNGAGHTPAAAVRLDSPVAHTAVGRRIDLQLALPYRAAVVLTAEHGEVLARESRVLPAGVHVWPMTAAANWAAGVTLRVRAMPLDAAGYALPPMARQATVELAVDAAPRPPRLSIALDRRRARPGETVQLALRSLAANPSDVTVLLIDRAVLDLAPDRAAALSPRDPNWRAALRRPAEVEWFDLADHRGAGRPHRKFEPRPVEGPYAESGGDLAMRTAVETETSRPLFGAEPKYFSGATLSTMEVLGSRIRRVDIVQAPMPHSRPATSRLRKSFAEVAHWQAHVVLKPGERRTLPITLPDNLGRWELKVLAADADDDFQMSEDAIEVSQPVEVRMEQPTSLVAGDRWQAIAQVRNASTRRAHLDAGIELGQDGQRKNAATVLTLAPAATGLVPAPPVEAAAGTIDGRVDARGPTGADALAITVPVTSAEGSEQHVQSGALGSGPVRLALPALGASRNPRLAISLSSRPLPDLAPVFTALRDYPHRCTEQILSREVAFAAATDLGGWSSARIDPATLRLSTDAVLEHLQRTRSDDDDGLLHYFPLRDSWNALPGDLALTAYALDALAEIDDPARLRDDRRVSAVLASVSHEMDRSGDAHLPALRDRLAATAASERFVATPAETWKSLAAELRKATSDDAFLWAQAARLAARHHDDMVLGDALAHLDQVGRRNGDRIEIGSGQRWNSVLDSRARSQCAVLDALVATDTRPGADERQRAWLLGLAPLVEANGDFGNTQANAVCLMTLRHYIARHGDPSGDPPVAPRLDGQALALVTGPDPHLASVELPLAGRDAGALVLDGGRGRFSAQVIAEVDRRTQAPAAQGLVLGREFSVWRERRWQPLATATPIPGEIVRIELTLDNDRATRMLALSDPTPAAWSPLSFDLVGATVPPADLVADSPWFDERQLDDRESHFYAAFLPPGRHRVDYYARVRVVGRTWALPARAEGMYQPDRFARSAPLQVDTRLEGDTATAPR